MLQDLYLPTSSASVAWSKPKWRELTQLLDPLFPIQHRNAPDPPPPPPPPPHQCSTAQVCSSSTGHSAEISIKGDDVSSSFSCGPPLLLVLSGPPGCGKLTALTTYLTERHTEETFVEKRSASLTSSCSIAKSSPDDASMPRATAVNVFHTCEHSVTEYAETLSSFLLGCKAASTSVTSSPNEERLHNGWRREVTIVKFYGEAAHHRIMRLTAAFVQQYQMIVDQAFPASSSPSAPSMPGLVTFLRSHFVFFVHTSHDTHSAKVDRHNAFPPSMLQCSVLRMMNCTRLTSINIQKRLYGILEQELVRRGFSSGSSSFTGGIAVSKRKQAEQERYQKRCIHQYLIREEVLQHLVDGCAGDIRHALNQLQWALLIPPGAVPCVDLHSPTGSKKCNDSLNRTFQLDGGVDTNVKGSVSVVSPSEAEAVWKRLQHRPNSLFSSSFRSKPGTLDTEGEQSSRSSITTGRSTAVEDEEDTIFTGEEENNKALGKWILQHIPFSMASPSSSTPDTALPSVSSVAHPEEVEPHAVLTSVSTLRAFGEIVQVGNDGNAPVQKFTASTLPSARKRSREVTPHSEEIHTMTMYHQNQNQNQNPHLNRSDTAHLLSIRMPMTEVIDVDEEDIDDTSSGSSVSSQGGDETQLGKPSHPTTTTTSSSSMEPARRALLSTIAEGEQRHPDDAFGIALQCRPPLLSTENSSCEVPSLMDCAIEPRQAQDEIWSAKNGSHTTRLRGVPPPPLPPASVSPAAARSETPSASPSPSYDTTAPPPFLPRGKSDSSSTSRKRSRSILDMMMIMMDPSSSNSGIEEDAHQNRSTVVEVSRETHGAIRPRHTTTRLTRTHTDHGVSPNSGKRAVVAVASRHHHEVHKGVVSRWSSSGTNSSGDNVFSDSSSAAEISAVPAQQRVAVRMPLIGRRRSQWYGTEGEFPPPSVEEEEWRPSAANPIDKTQTAAPSREGEQHNLHLRSSEQRHHHVKHKSSGNGGGGGDTPVLCTIPPSSRDETVDLFHSTARLLTQKYALVDVLSTLNVPSRKLMDYLFHNMYSYFQIEQMTEYAACVATASEVDTYRATMDWRENPRGGLSGVSGTHHGIQSRTNDDDGDMRGMLGWHLSQLALVIMDSSYRVNHPHVYIPRAFVAQQPPPFTVTAYPRVRECHRPPRGLYGNKATNDHNNMNRHTASFGFGGSGQNLSYFYPERYESHKMSNNDKQPAWSPGEDGASSVQQRALLFPNGMSMTTWSESEWESSFLIRWVEEAQNFSTSRSTQSLAASRHNNETVSSSPLLRSRLISYGNGAASLNSGAFVTSIAAAWISPGVADVVREGLPDILHRTGSTSDILSDYFPYARCIMLQHKSSPSSNPHLPEELHSTPSASFTTVLPHQASTPSLSSSGVSTAKGKRTVFALFSATRENSESSHTSVDNAVLWAPGGRSATSAIPLLQLNTPANATSVSRGSRRTTFTFRPVGVDSNSATADSANKNSAVSASSTTSLMSKTTKVASTDMLDARSMSVSPPAPPAPLSDSAVASTRRAARPRVGITPLQLSILRLGKEEKEALPLREGRYYVMGSAVENSRKTRSSPNSSTRIVEEEEDYMSLDCNPDQVEIEESFSDDD